MKRRYLGWLLLNGGLCGAFTPGSWEGTIPMLGLPLGLNVVNDSTVTIDSPKQGAFDMECEVDYIGEDSLSVSIDRIGLRLAGRLKPDGRVDVTLTQGPYSFPFQMERSLKAKPDRPQEPKPPFPYESVETSFFNGCDSLAGTLTIAPGSEVAVVMVTGSGLQNRDEELMGHKPFAVIADYLGRNGVSSFRYDDRGVGASGGNFAAATTADFAQDAKAALEFVRQMGRFKKIGVLGHSEGGRIGWKVAEDADFIVSLAGPGVRGDSVLLQQNRDMLSAKGINPEAYVEALDAVLHGGEPAADAPFRDNLLAGKKQLESPWFRYFLSDDPSANIRNVKVPTLALFGSKDLQVNAKQNAEAIRRLNPGIEVRIIEGVNHLFQPCTTGLPDEYPTIPTTISPEVLEVIAAFIKKQ